MGRRVVGSVNRIVGGRRAGGGEGAWGNGGGGSSEMLDLEGDTIA